jgi:hypothetical protein
LQFRFESGATLVPGHYDVSGNQIIRGREFAPSNGLAGRATTTGSSLQKLAATKS